VVGLDLNEELPTPPSPTAEELAQKQTISDWTELFFEWHKTIGIIALKFSFVLPESRGIKRIARLKYTILTALLNRCARLTMANLRMASEDRHAEAISIVDRSLHETAIKLIWLCRSRLSDRFERYLADGLKNDLDFRNIILSNVKQRGYKYAIENRMLNSIKRSVGTSALSSRKIRNAKKLPDLYSMMTEVGFADLGYVVVQKMGSHHVHGTWSGLLAYSLDIENSKSVLRSKFNSPHPYQLMFSSALILEAVQAFVDFVCREKGRREVSAKVEDYRNRLFTHNEAMAGSDRERSS
jgi:hypothetical protein